MLRSSNVRLVALAAAVLVVSAACGGSGDSDGSPVGATAATVSDNSVEVEEIVEELAESLEEIQEAEGGGSATLVVGGGSWTFDKVLCGFGPEEIGDPDAEFVLSALQDGLQLYVSIDGFGQYVELADIANFEDPSVHFVADSSMSMSGEDFIVVNGKQVSATGSFFDEATENYDGIEGTLTATCP